MASKFVAEYAHYAPDLFEGVNDFKQFMAKMETFRRKPYYAHFVGFCWEYVVAEYFKKFGQHDTVNVCEYSQTYAGSTKGDEVDFGVDGWGWNINRDGRIACQVKFRANKSAKIADEFEGVSTMNTFVTQIINDLRTQGKPRKKTIVVLVTTTTEFNGCSDLQTMDRSAFWFHVKEEMTKRGVDTTDMVMQLFGYNYWLQRLNNVRFWDIMRKELDKAFPKK